MYSEPLHSVREYVQNAFDSIREARRSGILKADQGEIRLTIDKGARSLRIRDDGKGLSPEAASVDLVDLGNSRKARSVTESGWNAGFRGIGRMAGITYCEMLRFETSNGKGRKCRVEFNAKEINRLTRTGQEPTTIADAIRNNTLISEGPEETDVHYLEVTLEGIKANSPFLDEAKLNDYLSRVAPVAYDPSVWTFGPKIHTFAMDAESEESLESVKISICNADGRRLADVWRPFKETLRTANAKGQNFRTIRVEDVVSLPRDGQPAESWWGWLAVHERRGALADVPFAGLRIYMHNIAVGDEGIVRDLFRSRSLATWCFGQIHITDYTLMPNAQRDNFEDSREWTQIKAQLRDESVWIEKEIRRESSERNTSVETLVKRAYREIGEAKKAIGRGFESRDEQETMARNLMGSSEKMEREKEKRKRSDEERQKLEEVRSSLEETARKVKEVPRTERDVAQAHLNRQTRKVIRTIFNVLKTELDERAYRRIEKKINTALRPGGKDGS